MTRRPQSRGTCAYCGQTLAKGGMSKHLAACPQRKAVIDAANAKKAADETLYHLRVQDAFTNDFWLTLRRAAPAHWNTSTSICAIWLECCGHLIEKSNKCRTIEGMRQRTCT